MSETTKHQWPVPDDTDRVSQGAAAMRALGEAIDGDMPRFATGSVTLSIPDAATVPDTQITFPAGRFTATPRVSVSMSTTRSSCAVTNLNSAGFTMSARMITGTSAVSVTIHWIAVQT